MSPIVNPDTSAVETIAALEAGTYPAKITGVDATTSKAGNPMIVVHTEVTDREGKTRNRDAYLVITGKGAYGFDQLLRVTGFTDIADRLKAGEKVPFDTDQLVGQQLNVIVETEPYNGQIRDNIRSFLAA